MTTKEELQKDFIDLQEHGFVGVPSRLLDLFGDGEDIPEETRKFFLELHRPKPVKPLVFYGGKRGMQAMMDITKEYLDDSKK